MIIMVLRPSIIYLSHFLETTEKLTYFNYNIQLALIWSDDIFLYFVFYFLIFKMRMIQMVITYGGGK
jgi:hypothetical protein